MEHSPAHVLGTYLVAQNLLDLPATGAAWPHWVNFKPENPHQAVVFYNTRGKMDGRLMRSGQTVEHPGIQTLVRAADDPTAFAKIQALAVAMDGIKNSLVVVDGVTYTIEAMTRTSGFFAVGQEQGNTRRLYSTNHTITLRAST